MKAELIGGPEDGLEIEYSADWPVVRLPENMTVIFITKRHAYYFPDPDNEPWKPARMIYAFSG